MSDNHMLASQQQARKAISRLLLIMQTAVGPLGGGGREFLLCHTDH